jgi:hypothetical protein
MCATPPKPKNRTPIEVKPPELQLGAANPAADVRLRMKRGRNQLRTDLGLSIPTLPAAGLSVAPR